MTRLRQLLGFLLALVHGRRLERELDEELAFHVDRETHKLIVSGVSPLEARVRALSRFGSVPNAADECRDARGTAFVAALARDIRYAFRTFRRAPLTAITIVGTVAVGLGLVAVMFTFYSALFLRADVGQNPSELFAVVRTTRPDGSSRY